MRYLEHTLFIVAPCSSYPLNRTQIILKHVCSCVIDPLPGLAPFFWADQTRQRCCRRPRRRKVFCIRPTKGRMSNGGLAKEGEEGGTVCSLPGLGVSWRGCEGEGIHPHIFSGRPYGQEEDKIRSQSIYLPTYLRGLLIASGN